MTGFVAAALVLGGLALLAGGGEALVRGAVALSRLAGLTPAVIGLTVVAMGTSLPELIVSMIAVGDGRPDLAVGNVLGSNIFNLTACLGATALIYALPVRGAVIRLEWPVLVIASGGTLMLMQDARLGRAEGVLLVMALAAFVAYSIRIARRDVKGQVAEAFEGEIADRVLGRESRWKAAASLTIGFVLLLIGGRMLVLGAAELARLAGMTERVIGLTVVAAGTGAPELATSIMAAVRRHTDVALANLIGSNIFNLLAILGVTAIAMPFEFSPEMGGFDGLWMLGVAVFLLPVLVSGGSIRRTEGGILLVAYVVYVGMLL